MADRDVERIASVPDFVAKLRRLADALESGGSFRIQVAGERFRVPRDAELSVEHEREGDSEEVELQMRWKIAGGEAVSDNAGSDAGSDDGPTV
jgi:amphi-Trp domain-containing protein